mgnify:CR=1 FL=1
MFRSLHMKLMLILLLLITSLMAVVGAFLMTSVTNFYIDDFYSQMGETFGESNADFVNSLRAEAAQEGGVAVMQSMLETYSGPLGIDSRSRNYYILDAASGECLAASDELGGEKLEQTANLLTARNGQVGDESDIAAGYMDVAIPISGGDNSYIIYIRDNRSTVSSLNSELLIIILQALLVGLLISVLLSFLLSKTMINPIEKLTEGAERVASGDFSEKLEVDSTDEIGILTTTFNDMASVLHSTLEAVEDERNKLDTLFLHMTDGVVAYDRDGALIHCNPAASELLERSADECVYADLFEPLCPFEKVMAMQRSDFVASELTVGERTVELYFAPFSDEERGGVLVVLHDVTQQRKAEERRREFVANVSHELRTPLTNIRSYAETIRDAGDELPRELEDISSTKIRENIDNHRDISSLIDPVVQEYIYHKGMYLREPEFKPILRAKAIAFENASGRDHAVLDELGNTVLYGHPDAQSILTRIQVENDRLLLLRNTVEGERPAGFVSYREIGNDELFGVLKDMELANLVRGKSSREILLITGIYAREENTGDSEMIRDAAQQLLVEVVAKELEKNYSFALFVAERGTAAKHVVYALERQGFVRPPLADENDKRTIYLVDMHEPLMFLHNLETTIKEPFASNPAVLRAIEKNHKKLQIAMTKLYPGNLVLSLSSGVMHHRLVDRITSLNDVPREPLVPRRLGKNMCVPFGKILRGKVVPNTVTKTLHTDKVYEPDLESYTIEPFPYYSPLNSQIETIRSFDRPVILVDDLVHKADRLRVLVPKLRETGIPIKKVVVGVLSGYGRDLMQQLKVPVESIYSMPNVRQWFVESTLYPFIGGDTVRREEMKVAGLQPSINMILPYATPKLSGCSREALVEFSACCIENSRDLLQVLEAEYRKQYAKNLTLSRLSEAVILPLCPDKGSCMEYDENLAASVYLENDLEMLQRMRKFMVTIQ